ncbi:MAG: DUF697 domain-containing protein [Verrucomicrobiota bacterium JB022]|nr:DUF697 domain-containing protein [Verrucomicrobiota bacterium JB022]
MAEKSRSSAEEPTQSAPEASAPDAVETAPAVKVSPDVHAEAIINRYTAFAAGGGVIPLPLVDLAVISGVQVKMLVELCKAYGVDHNEKTAEIALGSVVGALGIFPLLQRFLASGFKVIPGVGQLLSLTAGPAAAAGITYGVGRVFAEHFANGGNLLNIDLSKAKSTFNKFYERGKQAVA